MIDNRIHTSKPAGFPGRNKHKESIMRIMSLILIALAITAISLSVPSRADAAESSAPLVQFLAKEACKGQSAPYKSGCNGYLHKRITQCKPATQCLDECSNLCDHWFSTNPGKKAQCLEGCQFIRSKE